MWRDTILRRRSVRAASGPRAYGRAAGPFRGSPADPLYAV